MKIPAVAFLLVSSLVFSSVACKKKDPEPEPPAPAPAAYDPEQQSTKDIFFATHMVTDLEMVTAFPGENDPLRSFYTSALGAANTVTWTRDAPAEIFSVSFNNVLCIDGKTRNGTISVHFGYDAVKNPSSNYSDLYRDYGFAAYMIFSNYSVDGWLVEPADPAQPVFIYNELSYPNFDPAQVNLKWKIKGKLKFSHASKGQITWDGELIKLLVNTADTIVFHPSKQQPVKWRKSKVSYQGYATGTTTDSKTYRMETGFSDQLLRDFTCAYLPPPNGSVQDTTYPFVSGVASFTTGNITQQQINFGPASPCDNKATISYQGQTYQVSIEQ